MKGDAILLNGGRGSCVDGQALAEVLADGRLWGAGLRLFSLMHLISHETLSLFSCAIR